MVSDRLHQRVRYLEELVEESGGRLKLGTLRWWIFADHRGIRRCVYKPGRRLLVDVDELERWLEEQAKQPARRLTFAEREALRGPRPRFRREGRR